MGQMSLERIDRRTNMMRKQVKKRSTVHKYKIEGPIHWEGDMGSDEEDEVVDSADSKGNIGWFLTQTPEWLPQLTNDNSGSDTTPSADDDVAV